MRTAACRNTGRKTVVLFQTQTSMSRVMEAALRGHHQTLTSTDERNGSWRTASPGSAIVETTDGPGTRRAAQEP